MLRTNQEIFVFFLLKGFEKEFLVNPHIRQIIDFPCES